MNENHMEQDPFISVREVTLCCPNAGYWNDMSPELKRKYFMPYWSEARLRRHMEMMKVFGFNSIQVSAAGQIAMNSGVRQDVWREKLVLICRLARELGLGVTQFVWGACFYDADRNAFVTDMDWHNPADRKRMEDFFRKEAFLAPWVGRVVTHWVDPGGPKPGCAQCSMDTTVEIHNTILSIFREHNPQIRGAYSNWQMNWMSDEWPSEGGWQPGHWPGYKGVRALAGHPGLDRNSDIVIGRANGNFGDKATDRYATSTIKLSDLEAIAAAGRRAGVWSWYTTDVEIRPALHVRTAFIQDYFNRMPDQVRDELSWMSVDDNCHGLNMQNLYIAGRLMQDRRQDANVLLDEFAVILMGKAHAAAVAQALRAIEQVRGSDAPYLNLGGCDLAALPQSEKDSKHLPLEWVQDNLANIERAIHSLTPVFVESGFKPSLPLTISPDEYLGELRAHLDAIRQFLAFLDESAKVVRLASQKAPAERIDAAIQALPQVIYDPAHTAGLEAMLLYRPKLAALKNVVQGK